MYSMGANNALPPRRDQVTMGPRWLAGWLACSPPIDRSIVRSKLMGKINARLVIERNAVLVVYGPKSKILIRRSTGWAGCCDATLALTTGSLGVALLLWCLAFRSVLKRAAVLLDTHHDYSDNGFQVSSREPIIRFILSIRHANTIITTVRDQERPERFDS